MAIFRVFLLASLLESISCYTPTPPKPDKRKLCPCAYEHKVSEVDCKCLWEIDGLDD